MPFVNFQTVGQFKLPNGTIAPVPLPHALQMQGPCLPVTLSVPRSVEQELSKQGKMVPPAIRGLALIDTGATKTAVSREQMGKLGLAEHGTTQLEGIKGAAPHPVFACMIRLLVPTNPGSSDPIAPIFLPDAAAVELTRYVAILGRDFLADKMLTYNGLTGHLTLSW